MAKPSIFSREYKRKMRARKRRVAIIAVIIMIAFGIVLSGGYVKGWLEKGISAARSNKNDAKSLLTGKNSEQEIDSSKTEESKPENVPSDNIEKQAVDNSTQESNVAAEKYYEITLPNNSVIKVVYEEDNEDKKLKYIKDEPNLYNDISPNSKSLVIWDSASQTMMLIDSEGNIKDITKPFYKTRNTGDTIQKEKQLARRPNYIWCYTPKFINDDTIAYVTNLPLISKSSQFIWAYDITKEEHVQIYTKAANTITFKDFIEGKLAIEIDGNPKYILSDRSIAN